MAVFKCSTIYNGVLYPAGANVPVGTIEQTKVEEKTEVKEEAKPVVRKQRKATRKE